MLACYHGHARMSSDSCDYDCTKLQGGQMVIYGCMGGKPPTWPWQSWVFKDLRVTGFNLRKWMADNSKQFSKMLEALGQLVQADKLKVAYTE